MKKIITFTSVMKTSLFSQVRSTSENLIVFIIRDEDIYGIYFKRVNFLFILLFFFFFFLFFFFFFFCCFFFFFLCVCFGFFSWVIFMCHKLRRQTKRNRYDVGVQ